MQTTKVILIGAGPIGLEMAVALKSSGIDYVHLEAKQVGHTISWFPRQARFFSSPERIAICGVPLMTTDQSKATREEYLAYLHGIVQQFDLAIQNYERVTALTKNGARFRVETQRADGKHEYHSEHVILAIGDMHKPRRLIDDSGSPIPGSDLPHVSHYFDEPHPYVRQRLLIVGGKNSAVEAAIRCYRAGAKVAISYRREQFDEKSIKYWLRPELDGLIRNGDIQFYPRTQPVEITPTTVKLVGTTDSSPMTQTESVIEVPTDFVLLLIGYEMDKRLLDMAGVKLQGENQAPTVNLDSMESNIPGLYVAGTAVAGTQIRFRLFIENCHDHVVRILRSIADQEPRHINSLAYQRLNEMPLAAES